MVNTPIKFVPHKFSKATHVFIFPYILLICHCTANPRREEYQVDVGRYFNPLLPVLNSSSVATQPSLVSVFNGPYRYIPSLQDNDILTDKIFENKHIKSHDSPTNSETLSSGGLHSRRQTGQRTTHKKTNLNSNQLTRSPHNEHTAIVTPSPRLFLNQYSQRAVQQQFHEDVVTKPNEGRYTSSIRLEKRPLNSPQTTLQTDLESNHVYTNIDLVRQPRSKSPIQSTSLHLKPHENSVDESTSQSDELEEQVDPNEEFKNSKYIIVVFFLYSIGI